MIQLLISDLVEYGIAQGLVEKSDEVYVTNRLMELLGCSEYQKRKSDGEPRQIHEILEDILSYAVQEKIIEEDTITAKDLFDTKVMGMMTPPPSVVQRIFEKKYESSPKDATDYYYAFSQATNYIRKDRIAKDEKWVTDITEFKYGTSFDNIHKLYLSVILDLCDRRPVAYVIGDSNNNQLVFDTFDLAVALNPNAHPIFHSDRGFQYTSRTFHHKLEQAGMIQSMSRVAHCTDNGPMEGFWGILKREMYYKKKFHSREELVSAIIEYIEKVF